MVGKRVRKGIGVLLILLLGFLGMKMTESAYSKTTPDQGNLRRGKYPVFVTAHRGFSGTAPENTLAAFRAAIDTGCDMIELDVHLSRDNQVVVIHDDTLERTTSGRGNVADQTYAELKRLDAGSWFDPRFSGERIPTLADVLSLARNRILVNIELKKGKKPALSAAPANGYRPYLVAKYLRGAEPVEFASVSDKNSISVGQHEIIIICDGSNSGETFIGFDGILSSTMAKVAHGAELDNKFLMHFLDSLFEQFNAGKTGSAIPHLDLPALRDQNLPVPPLPEQQRIVGILDDAFDGIATAKDNAEQNLQNARALFESHLQSVFTQRGEGWVEKKLSDVCAITSTLVDPRKKEFLDLTHVGAGNIESQTGVFVDLKTAREEGLISGKFLFDDSMVLYSKIRPYLMKVARPNFNGLCSADMYPLAPLSNEITRDYLFHLLLSKSFTDYAIQGSARAGMPKVNREHLFEYRTWLPDVKVQKKLTAQLDALHEETQRLQSLYQRKLAALDELKKSLLHQAFSGAL